MPTPNYRKRWFVILGVVALRLLFLQDLATFPLGPTTSYDRIGILCLQTCRPATIYNSNDYTLN